MKLGLPIIMLSLGFFSNLVPQKVQTGATYSVYICY